MPFLGPEAAEDLPATTGDRTMPCAVILAALAGAFAVRVAAQAIQELFALPFLPPAAAFQGSSLPYALLLPAQIVILAAMLAVVWWVHIGKLELQPRASRWLTVAGALYVAAMLARLAIGFAIAGAPAWFRADIPTAFHLVLALFLLVLARHRRSPRRATHGDLR